MKQTEYNLWNENKVMYINIIYSIADFHTVNYYRYLNNKTKLDKTYLFANYITHTELYGYELVDQSLDIIKYICNIDEKLFCYSWLCRIGYNYKTFNLVNYPLTWDQFAASYIDTLDIQKSWDEYEKIDPYLKSFIDDIVDNFDPYDLHKLYHYKKISDKIIWDDKANNMIK